MNWIGNKVLIAFASSQMLWGCAVLDESLPAGGESSTESQRVAVALASLRDLEHVDAYIKLDNDPLRKQIRDVLQAQAAATGVFEFNRIRVRFARQVIVLEATLQVANGPDEVLNAALHGDVILTFSGNQLIWLPRFDQLGVSDTGFVFEEKSYPVATGELEENLLRRVNRDIADAVIVLGTNEVQVNPLPLGEIVVGAALTNFTDVVSSNTHPLGGVFTVAGSTILIEPGVTSIAVDLEFIPNISACPADLYVSRSAFAREIRNREPVGVTRLISHEAAKSHFFTEISGATRSSVIVHYWFADGRPVALEELAVEPSYRWRTWSSMTIDRKVARNWEVIVVEKETGCILHSLAIRTDPATTHASDEPAAAQLGFAAFRDEFEQRVAEFSILDDSPDVALIEVPRPFLNDALHASLKDIQIVVDFNVSRLPSQKLTGSLQPFNIDDILCTERKCGAHRECDAGFTQCARQRDNRDCSTCLFRNPLNNRCVNEGIDPICEAAKSAQNERHDAARSSCMEREAATRRDCERLQTQEIRSCEIEAASEQSACEAGRQKVLEYADAGPFAEVTVQLDTSGGLVAVFSDFKIEGDLASIRQSLIFSAALKLSGAVRFAPKQALGPLASCMNAWQKSFEGMVALPQLANSMIGAIALTETALVADWSGYEVTASIKPTPLEAMFVENPNLLADCGIGLTVGKVATAVTGDSSDFVAGHYVFEIQPLPSRIDLAQASVAYGDETFEAPPELSPTHLKYEVTD